MIEEEKSQAPEEGPLPETDPGPPIVELIGESDPGPPSMDAVAGSKRERDEDSE